MRSKSLASAATFVAALGLLLGGAAPAQAATVAFPIVLDASSPTWDFDHSCGAQPPQDPHVDQPYQATTLTVTEDGAYTFARGATVVTPPGTSYEGAFAVYDTTFTPATPATSCIAFSPTSGVDPSVTATLTAGTTYILVSTEYFWSGETLSATVTASGPGDIVLAASPSVTVEQAAAQPDPATTLPIAFDVVFSEAVVGFDAADVALGGTAGAGDVSVTGSGASYVVTVQTVASPGTVTASVPAAAATATATGLPTSASTSTDAEVTYAPVVVPTTVAVSAASDQAEPATVDGIAFDVEFSGPVEGFDASDVAVGGSAGATVATVAGSGAAYAVTVTGVQRAGDVTISVPEGAATDLEGDPTAASGTASVTFDPPVPTPVVTLAGDQPSETDALPAVFVVDFGMAATELEPSDILVSGTAGGSGVEITQSAATYGQFQIVRVTEAASAGTIAISVVAGAVEGWYATTNPASEVSAAVTYAPVAAPTPPSPAPSSPAPSASAAPTTPALPTTGAPLALLPLLAGAALVLAGGAVASRRRR